jgi:hypothetical protein
MFARPKAFELGSQPGLKWGVNPHINIISSWFSKIKLNTMDVEKGLNWTN